MAPEGPGSLLAGPGLFSWLDGCRPNWRPAHWSRRIGESFTADRVLPGLLLVAFALDAWAPHGLAAWLLYAVPLAWSHRGARLHLPLLLAAAGTILLSLAWLHSPTDAAWQFEAFNRVLFAGALWLAAAWMVRHRRAAEALKQSEDRWLQMADSLEQRVRQRTAQLEAANGELEAFAYSVSHDLRAPLRVVDGFARVVEEEHRGRLNADGLHALTVIREETGRMSCLINHLLELARVGRQAVHAIDTDMSALAREVFARLRDSATAPEVDFQLGVLPVAQGDPTLLRQVWSNLLDNALKYTRRRQRAEIRVVGWRQDGELIYCVHDNGAGFDMQHADRLFRAFQRLHGSDEFEGHGVGLALVQRIVLRHGGRVWAESHPGRGASFFFALPVTSTEAS